MGSGTTGEAALNLKRRFIGIEVDKEHYSRTKQRLSKIKINLKVILAMFLMLILKMCKTQSKKEVKERNE